MGFMCTSEESKSDDAGFISDALSFVLWVDTTTAPVDGVVQEVVTLFFLTDPKGEKTDGSETVSETSVTLFRGSRNTLIRAAFDFSDVADGAPTPVPCWFVRQESTRLYLVVFS